MARLFIPVGTDPPGSCWAVGSSVTTLGGVDTLRVAPQTLPRGCRYFGVLAAARRGGRGGGSAGDSRPLPPAVRTAIPPPPPSVPPPRLHARRPQRRSLPVGASRPRGGERRRVGRDGGGMGGGGGTRRFGTRPAPRVGGVSRTGAAPLRCRCRRRRPCACVHQLGGGASRAGGCGRRADGPSRLPPPSASPLITRRRARLAGGPGGSAAFEGVRWVGHALLRRQGREERGARGGRDGRSVAHAAACEPRRATSVAPAPRRPALPLAPPPLPPSHSHHPLCCACLCMAGYVCRGLATAAGFLPSSTRAWVFLGMDGRG